MSSQQQQQQQQVNQAVLMELDALQTDLGTWMTKSQTDLQRTYTALCNQLRQIEHAVQSGGPLPSRDALGFNKAAAADGTSTPQDAGVAKKQQPTPQTVAQNGAGPSSPGGRNSNSSSTDQESAKATPVRGGQQGGMHARSSGVDGFHNNNTPSLASPPVSHALNYDMLIEEVERETRPANNRSQQQQQNQYQQQHNASTSSQQQNNNAANHSTDSCPNAQGIARALAPAMMSSAYSGNNNNMNQSRQSNNGGGGGSSQRPTAEGLPAEALSLVKPANRQQQCYVLVEFKRQRVLQFESAAYVAPGEFVVVGGDRGEDIGLVTYSWPASSNIQPPNPTGKWIGAGVGKVLRVATILEVSQLQGVQTELENRALEVAQGKVLEHNLPMSIVDAEYQFDRKKLTFYYQSQHRLDFRNLVRDLYKTFRARIWMEMDN